MWSLKQPQISVPRNQATWNLMGDWKSASKQELMLISHPAKNILSVSVKNTRFAGFRWSLSSGTKGNNRCKVPHMPRCSMKQWKHPAGTNKGLTKTPLWSPIIKDRTELGILKCQPPQAGRGIMRGGESWLCCALKGVKIFCLRLQSSDTSLFQGGKDCYLKGCRAFCGRQCVTGWTAIK